VPLPSGAGVDPRAAPGVLDLPRWVFTQSGGSVGGVWKGNASGTLSGTMQGCTLSGTLVNNEANQSASFSITLAADGHSFSGTFTNERQAGAELVDDLLDCGRSFDGRPGRDAASARVDAVETV
jgi:hypothetical protein